MTFTKKNTRRYYDGRCHRECPRPPAQAPPQSAPILSRSGLPRPEFRGERVLKIKASFITAAIALGASCAFADPLQPSFERALPPAKINAIVHSMGLVPVGQPIRKGFTYVVYANNRLGRSVRIVVDARFGKVLAVQRVIAVIPPGTYPVPQPVDGASRRARMHPIRQVPRSFGPLMWWRGHRRRFHSRNQTGSPLPGPRARPPRLSPSAPRALNLSQTLNQPATRRVRVFRRCNPWNDCTPIAGPVSKQTASAPKVHGGRRLPRCRGRSWRRSGRQPRRPYRTRDKSRSLPLRVLSCLNAKFTFER